MNISKQFTGSLRWRSLMCLLITALVYAMIMVSIFLLFCSPQDDSERWILEMVLTKAGSVIIAYTAYGIYKYFFHYERDNNRE